jgi:cytochrome c
MRLRLRRPGLRRAAPFAVVIAGALVVATAARAEDPDPAIAGGRAFAEQNCGSCHAIGPSGESPLAKAPPFRSLHERYPVEHLTEALAEGIRIGHPAMPQFDDLDTEQIDALIAYLKSLEVRPGPR